MDAKSEIGVEWRRSWLIAIAAMFGSGVSSTYANTIGVFIQPITGGLGWKVSDVTLGIFICSVVAVPGSPFAGWLAARFGLQRLLLWGLPMFLMAFASLGILSHSHFEWILGWMALALFGIPLKTNVWMLWTAQKFNAARGMAFAVVMSGSGLFGMFMPIVAQSFIERLGWRGAFPAMAALLAVLSIPLCFVALRSSRPARLASLPPPPPPPPPPPEASDAATGLILRQAMRRRHFWQLMLIAFLCGAGMFSLQTHLVPMLELRKLDAHTAAIVVGGAGASALLGRFVVGTLLDWAPARLIGVVSLLAPAVACLLYVTVPFNYSVALAITMLLGLGIGAEGDVLGYLTTRYLGLRSFGVIYGAICGVMSLGAGIGPLTMAIVRDRLGSYDLIVEVLFFALTASALLIATLGRYPDLTDRTGADGDGRAIAARARPGPLEPLTAGAPA